MSYQKGIMLRNLPQFNQSLISYHLITYFTNRKEKTDKFISMYNDIYPHLKCTFSFFTQVKSSFRCDRSMKYFIENSRKQKLSMPLTYEVRVESADKNYVQGFTKDLSPTSCSCKDPLCCLTCLNITAVIQIYQIQSIVHEEQHGVYMNKSTLLCFIYVLYTLYIDEFLIINHFETQTINKRSKQDLHLQFYRNCALYLSKFKVSCKLRVYLKDLIRSEKEYASSPVYLRCIY